jgi:ubiquinone/menaquinone biosynthesis C-methylase UbiE
MSRSVLRHVDRRSRVSPERLQHEFYTATADEYDRMMVGEGDPHDVALDLISALIDGYDLRSILDVGSGTGRGVRHFLERHDGVEVRGVEPVSAMIEQAERTHDIPPGCIAEADGAALPFPGEAFDAVCELGVLHHVPNPNEIVAEMTRVARRAVFLSDDNRFAGGSRVRRGLKWTLHRIGVWPAVYRLANGGRPYHLSATDGVSYSYSVYDSLDLLNSWADRVFLVPLTPTRHSQFHPLFSAPNLLACALRDR